MNTDIPLYIVASRAIVVLQDRQDPVLTTKALMAAAMYYAGNPAAETGSAKPYRLAADSSY